MYYGGDYNPEQWPEATWIEDVALMREAGVTMVSLGIFSWSRIQPAEGVFDFEWLDRVIDLLHEGGIQVDLATATASPPPWMHEAYPDILPKLADGTVLGPGSRQHFAPSSPTYRRLAGDLVRALAERYVDHPAVVMWHVNNEYGCHVNYDYSDAAAAHFRAWLARRYGSIDALNSAWGTDFWAQRYTAFSQILPPRTAPYSHNPTQLLDFRRFTSDTLLECYLMEKQILLEAGATQPITTNFMGAFPPLDYREWARHVDVVTDDSYPDPNDPESFRAAAFARDLMRSLKPGTPWILMEQATNALNWRPTNAPKAPGQMAALSMQAIGRGADGILFFQWRQGRAGAEKFHSAMLPQAGTNTRTWREVVQLGAELSAMPELPSPTQSRAAIVFDWDNWWAVKSPDHPVEIDYLAVVHDWHAAFHTEHIQVDLVASDADLSGYAIVVAPQLYVLREDAAANLRDFTESGGHLIVGAFSDVVDENEHFREGGFLTQLGETLGVRLEDFGALQIDPDGPGERVAEFTLNGVSVAGATLAEELHVEGATVVASYDEGRRAGDPAFTRRANAWYLGTIPDRAGLGVVVRHVLSVAGVEPVIPNLPVFVELSERGELLTLINQGATTVEVDIAGESFDTGERVALASLSPFEVVRLRR